jgi:hypothetical protein
MKYLSAAVAAFLLVSAGPASADGAGALPVALEAALERAVPEGRDADWRFLLTYTSPDGQVVARFDGSLPAEARWSLVSPAEAELDEAQRGIWAEITGESAGDDGDGGLFFDAEDAVFLPDTLEPAGEQDGFLAYGFLPQFDPEDEEEAAFAAHLRGEIAIAVDPAGVRRLRLWAPESFKPHIAVRIHEFELEQEYAELDGLPAPVLTRMSQRLSGSAAFQRFEERFELEFSEIEYLAR